MKHLLEFVDDFGLPLEEGFVLPAAQKMVLRDMLQNKRRWRDWPGGFYVPEGETRAKEERLFSTYVLWHVIRSLLRKNLITQRLEKGVNYFSVTPEGARALGFLPD